MLRSVNPRGDDRFGLEQKVGKAITTFRFRWSGAPGDEQFTTREDRENDEAIITSKHGTGIAWPTSGNPFGIRVIRRGLRGFLIP
jgi:hypothetical protein